MSYVLTILAVRDLEKALQFYGVFGWEQAVSTPVYAELRAPGGMRLGLYQRAGFGRNIGREPIEIGADEVGPAEIYLHCEDLDGTIARVRRAGARALSPRLRRDWGDDAAYFADPDGHILALAKPSLATEGIGAPER